MVLIVMLFDLFDAGLIGSFDGDQHFHDFLQIGFIFQVWGVLVHGSDVLVFVFCGGRFVVVHGASELFLL